VERRAIIGREVPLRALEGALAAPPRVVLVCGEAGIGKTRLVTEVEAVAAGWLVLHGECVEFGGEELAYAPVVAALRDLPAAWLADWLDDLCAEARGALAAVLPREAWAAAGRDGCSSWCSTCWPAWTARSCSCSRTSTGPIARRPPC
jgi:predicted ATPase